MTSHRTTQAPPASVGQWPLRQKAGDPEWSWPEQLALLVLAPALLLYFLLPYPLALLAGVTAVLSAVAAPRVGLLAALVTVPLVSLTRPIGSLAFSSSELMIGASVIGSAARLLAPTHWPVARPSFAPTPFDRPAALLLLSALLSLLVTEYLRLSLRELRTLILEPLLAFYLLAAWFPGRRSVWPIGALLAGCLAIAGAGLAGMLVGWGLSEAEGVSRLQALYASPNHFGLVLGRALPWLLAFGWLIPSWRLPAVLGALLVGGALVGTFSIGAWLGSAASILLLGGLLGGRRAVAVAGGALLGLGTLALVLLRVERVWSHFDPERGTTFFRLRLWESAFSMIRDHPLLGVGLDNFLYLYQQRYIHPSALAEANLSHPHNLVLHFWVQLGLLGLLAAFWLLATAFWIGLGIVGSSQERLPRALAAGSLASLADFVVHGLVDNSYFLPDLALIFWLTLAVIAANWPSKP